MTPPFYTIGHSTRSLDGFIALMKAFGIAMVADIRTVPRSRTNPQFIEDVLRRDLAASGLSYEHVAALGGLRGKSKTVPAEVNGLWRNDSFHNYADYALSPEFRAALEHLRGEGHRRRCAMMCAEAVWWRCHRRIVADYLIVRNEPVFHIMGEGRLEPARLTPGAVAQPDGTVRYPPEGPVP